jgi:uncharacterized membrane protein
MRKIISTCLIGGLGVLLPIALFAFLAKWVYDFVTQLIQPLSTMAVGQGVAAEWLADIVVIVALIALCFVVGFIVRTRLGALLWNLIDKNLLQPIPGYSIIKDTIHQFVGNQKSPFSQVALVDIFGSGVRVTGFITDDSHPEITTVFVPTGPNPTSGNICHVPKNLVETVDIPVEKAMRSIISCGSGSAALTDASQHVIQKAAVAD